MAADAPITFRQLAARGLADFRNVGPKRLDALAAVGIESVLDLLTHYPRRYVDRTREGRIAELAVGEEAMVVATVRRIESRRVRGNRSMVIAEVADDSGRLKVTFFNQAWRERQLPVGTEAVIFGRLEEFRGARQMTNPVVDLIGTRTGRIIPVYPQSEKSGLSTWEIGDLAAEALRRCQARGLADPVPAAVLAHHELIGREEALFRIHLPESMADVAAARRRLVFDELLRIQVALVARKREIERTESGIAQVVAGGAAGLVDRFVAGLRFPLTGAQRRVIDELTADLAAPRPMHRLLQGDVGAGKTVVAVAALLTAVQGGHQGALMAPTEVLAEQHARSVVEMVAGLERGDVGGGDSSRLFDDAGVRVALLTNRVAAAERKRVLAALAAGEVDLVVGTHALIADGVGFRSLGVVVIDEQHRFGVEQRAALRAANADGTVPDVLVMTATPIPRTAAMTVYGDLDVSVLDELPPGRTPIRTEWVNDEPALDRMWGEVRAVVAEGQQAYVVCPLIDESEKVEVASATETYERLAALELSGLRVGLLHGRMPSVEKDAVMDAFRAGRLDVLVATTVIEVGVDVPNATAMVVLDADRFGIAQLHQLRGRVGRGSVASVCWLVSGEPTPDGTARLEAMVRTTDGFELAEVDLDLRGEGTIMGERQKGRNDLKLASLRRDREWVEIARGVAFDLVGDGSGLAAHPDLVEEIEVCLGEDDTEFLMKG